MLQGKGIISNFHQEIIKAFSQLPNAQQFYLTGGTALAEFYIHHRYSYDLDFFTNEKELILPFSFALEKNFSEKFDVKIIRRFETFANFMVAGKNKKDSVKLDLAFDSPFHFQQPVPSNLEINVNSYNDIIVDKLLAFFGRAEMRDAIDVYFISQKENIDNLLALAPQKDAGFDLYWMAVTCEKVKNFPDEITQWKTEMIKPAEAKDIKLFFSALTEKIMNKISEKDRQ